MTDPAYMSAELATRKHMQRVSELLGEFAILLIQRAAVHDLSKLTPMEICPLSDMQRLIDAEGQAPYGSDEYKRRTALLGPMLENHYADNSHHPEHYGNGVNGMDLLDLVEMFLDWKAASERGEESAMNLSHSVVRFKIEPQLGDIFVNTAKTLGFRYA